MLIPSALLQPELAKDFVFLSEEYHISAGYSKNIQEEITYSLRENNQNYWQLYANREKTTLFEVVKK